MTVFVNLIRCPDCDALTFDPRDQRCTAPCPYCGDVSEPDFQGCVDSGCSKPACQDWREAERRADPW